MVFNIFKDGKSMSIRSTYVFFHTFLAFFTEFYLKIGVGNFLIQDLNDGFVKLRKEVVTGVGSKISNIKIPLRHKFCSHLSEQSLALGRA